MAITEKHAEAELMRTAQRIVYLADIYDQEGDDLIHAQISALTSYQVAVAQYLKSFRCPDDWMVVYRREEKPSSIDPLGRTGTVAQRLEEFQSDKVVEGKPVACKRKHLAKEHPDAEVI